MKTIAMLLLLCACGGSSTVTPWACDSTRGDFCVSGMLVQGLPAAAQTDLIRGRLEQEVFFSTYYWGADINALAGWRLVYVNYLEANASGLPGCPASVGCGGITHAEEKTIYLRLEFASCPEYSSLPHEIGHVILDGDPFHDDPKWLTVATIAPEALSMTAFCQTLIPQVVNDADYWSHPLHDGSPLYARE